MRKYKVGDKVTLNPKSNFYGQCLDRDRNPTYGEILEVSHFRDFHWRVRWEHSGTTYHYYESDLFPIATNNEQALFFLSKDN